MAAPAPPSCCGDERTGLLQEDLSFEKVLQEERALLLRKWELRGGQGRPSKPFSLAFSGGGIRAAAFQAGVLWRLAEQGLLRDVEYLCAVSGGAYVASAFASHLHEEPPSPPPASASSSLKGDQDAWYRAVVARALVRMQRNAGIFVRDPEGAAGWHPPRDGSGTLPRALDLPLLCLTLLTTLVVNPLQLLIVYLVPITEAIMLFFGAALRAAFCAPSGLERWDVLMAWSPFGLLLKSFEACLLLTFLAWAVSKLPFFQLGPKNASTGRRACSLSYLFLYSARACLARMSALLLLAIVLIWGVPQTQIWQYQADFGSSLNQTRQGFCLEYMRTGGADLHSLLEGQESRAMGCANYYEGRPWYRDAKLLRLTERLDRPKLLRDDVRAVENMALDVYLLRSLHRFVLAHTNSVLSGFFCLFLVLALAALVLLPLFPNSLFHVLSVAGPVAALLLTQLFVQYRVYGPLTGQPLFFSLLPFDHASWDAFMFGCLLLSAVMVPCYNDVQRVWHWYYLRSLQQNFFAGGRDLSMEELGSDGRCPLLLYTGTVSDFKLPGSNKAISEISFSPLHTGSETTSYVRTPRYRTLAKCTALTAAGCLDAISLSMTNHVRFRFWLEVLNLSWGDFLLFEQPRRAGSWAGSLVGGPAPERSLGWIYYRGPQLLATFSAGIAFVSGWYLAKQSGNAECRLAKDLVLASVLASGLLFALSFFAFLPGLGWLMMSPQHRQFHQATMFHFQDARAPGLLYVTDGGVQDCTGIVQLVRRRCERVLLVLAAHDPNDELEVLRAAMEVARQGRLASFYDPTDARRDVRALLDDFAEDRSRSLLEVGIRYGWGPSESAATGRLLVVKNRLPPSLEKEPVRPLLTEQEILGTSDSPPGAAGGMSVSQLGGLGCCDCCHRRGCNCGGKFPHLTGANYLWLTPQLFSSLCRLGFEVSKEAVARLKEES